MHKNIFVTENGVNSLKFSYTRLQKILWICNILRLDITRRLFLVDLCVSLFSVLHLSTLYYVYAIHRLNTRLLRMISI